MIRNLLKCIWAVMLLVGCGNQAQKLREGRELAVQVAPDGLSKAFVWLPELKELGATVSQPYQVWMQSLKGKEQQTLIFEADKTDGVHLLWKTPVELEICYGAAQITRFRNFFVVAEQGSSRILKIEIVLRKVQRLSDCGA